MTQRPGIIGAVWLALVLAASAWISGCEKPRVSARRPGPLRVVVSAAPLLGLVRPLLPPDADVSVLVPAGRSLHGYEMTPGDLASVAEADLVVHVGLGLEPALDRSLRAHPSEARRVVCFAHAAGVEEADEDHDHEDGDGHAHADGENHGTDPHLWLDPELVLRLIPQLAQEIEDALRDAGKLTSVHEDRLRDAKFTLMADVEAVDEEYRTALAPFAGAAIVTHHNAFGRVAGRYGLRIAAVIRPIEGAEPSAAQIAEAVEAIRRERARAVFFEPQYNPAAARAIADAAGVPSGVLDPEGGEDWFVLMRSNLASLVKMLAEP